MTESLMKVPPTALRLSRRQFWSRMKNLWLDASDFEVSPISILRSSPYESRVSKWRALSDRDYRGSSVSEVEVLDSGVHFKGEVNVPPAENDEETKRGFCAVKGNLTRVIDLRDYQGIELCLHSDTAMNVTFNMTCLSYIRDDLYQISLNISPNRDILFYIPFPAFM